MVVEKANFWIVIYNVFDSLVEINNLITGSADFVTIRHELVVYYFCFRETERGRLPSFLSSRMR